MPGIDDSRYAPTFGEQPDSHYEVLATAIPEWLLLSPADRRTLLKNTAPQIKAWYKTAAPEQHRQLRLRNATHWTAQNQVEQRLANLQDAKAFAAPLLEDALRSQFGLTPDVRETFLQLYIPTTIPWFPVKTGAARTWNVSLLDAALHNFEASETRPDAFGAPSTFITRPDANGRFHPLPQVQRSLSIPAFAQLCRTLDIGTRYKSHLEENLGISNALVATVLQQEVMASQRAALEAALHLARIQNDVDETTLQALQGVLDGRPSMQLAGKPIRCHDLRMMSARLTGIVLFAPNLESQHSSVPVVAYVPDDPEHPIKHYPSTAAFASELTRQLRNSDYQHFFSRFVAHEDRGYFFADLNSRLGQITWHPHQPTDPQPTWRETPKERPNLQLSASLIPGRLLTHLYQQTLDKILNDAQVIAVSTARVDQKARWALWDSFQQVATSLLNIAALVIAPFVPVLGEAMLVYMAYQVLDEVFEGILDWTQGQTLEAFGHLMGFIETLVQLGTFGAGGAIVASEFRALLPQSTLAFIDSFKPVKTPRGKTLYWKPDLTPYTRKIPLPERSTPNEQGIHQHLDESVITLDNTPYALNKLPGSDDFHLSHPERADAYQPKVWHNSTGAWQTELDQPLYWDSQTLMRRLGHGAKGFSADELEQIRRVSNTPDNVLRQMHVQRQPTPLLLEDTLKRFNIEQDIETFIQQMNSDDPALYRNASVMTQLQLLCDSGVWPETKALHVFDGEGRTLWQYATRDDVPKVHINQAQLDSGDLLKTVLLALDESEVKTLLGEEFGQPRIGIDARTRALRQKLARTAQAQKANLFESRYNLANRTTHGAAQRLIDSKPGLPAAVAEALLEKASDVERADLSHGKIPPRLDQLARWARQETRLNRAYEGLYLEAQSNADSHILALHSLPELPGWSGNVRLEIREHTFNGRLRDSIGQATAPERKVLVHEDGEYEVFDGEGLHLFGSTDFYNAVLQALPDSERNHLSLHIQQGPQLRKAISKVVLPRDRLLPLLEQHPVRPPAAKYIQRLPGGMDGYPMPAHPMPQPGATLTLEQRAQALYPSLTREQIHTLISQLQAQHGSALLRLIQLDAQYTQLSQDLATWATQTPTVDPLDQVPLPAPEYAYEQLKRMDLSEEIRRCWRRETELIKNASNTPIGYSLVYDEPIMGQLPTLTANFDHVSTLSLTGDVNTSGGTGFIQHFPNLYNLELRRMPLGMLPEGLANMPHLTELVLDSCNVRLTEQSVAQLSSMSQLTSLDLYSNPLGQVPSVEAMPNLTYLDLSSTGIDRLPPGLLTRPQLRSAILNNNRISELPDALFDLPNEISEGVDLESNPFPDALIERIKQHYHDTGERWEASAQSADIERLKALYPTFHTYECSNFLYGLPGDLAAGRAELTRLGAEYEQLSADLQEWQIDVPTHHPVLGLEILPTVRADEQVKRQGLKQLLEACWRRETKVDKADSGHSVTHELNYSTTLLGDLPRVSANFDHVTLLSLSGEQATAGITGFLQMFPKLNTLSISGYRLGSIPEQVFQLRRLNKLMLPQCEIQLTPATNVALADLHQLTYLDLSDNLLGITPRVGNMQQLVILDLQATGIAQVPPGLFSLRKIQVADLSDNAIRHIDNAIHDLPVHNFNALLWNGNPLSPRSLATLRRYAQRHRLAAIED